MFGKELKQFYNNRRVFITGHTGFKGAWLCILLKYLGADICGYALDAPTNPSLFEICNVSRNMKSVMGDIRDFPRLMNTVRGFEPEIVLHLAAQPLVRESYEMPVYTYETNVMGTINILECCREIESIKSVINVTTDKVYYNDERNIGFVESDYLDGFDPYSNSKSCSELVTHSYVNSFLRAKKIAVSTCRAGNVVGGGDFAKDRIIPDAIRAFEKNEKLIVRNPNSVRPYQHVLEALVAYLVVAMRQFSNCEVAGAYNIGPSQENCITTRALADYICDEWGENVGWKSMCDNGPHEANFLKLDCSKMSNTFEWKPKWDVEETVSRIVKFEKMRLRGATSEELMMEIIKQASEYLD